MSYTHHIFCSFHFTSVIFLSSAQYANDSIQHVWHLQPPFSVFSLHCHICQKSGFCYIQHIQQVHMQVNCLWHISIFLFHIITDIITCLASTLAERHIFPPYELICQEQDRSVPLPLLLIGALRQLLKWEHEIRWVGGMRYHKLNWDLICDGISKHPVWRRAGSTLGGMSSPSGQTIALRLCKQFLITSVWLTGDFDPSPRHK